MAEIKLGDIVTLKSDASVKMTVGCTTELGIPICFYFLNGEIRSFEIRKEALVKVEATDSLSTPLP